MERVPVSVPSPTVMVNALSVEVSQPFSLPSPMPPEMVRSTV